MRISDWSSDVCSSDLCASIRRCHAAPFPIARTNRVRVRPRPACNRASFGRPKRGEWHGSCSKDRGRCRAEPHIQRETERAWCRERGCLYVKIQVVEGDLKKK